MPLAWMLLDRFVLYYPLIMSLLWTSGGLLFYVCRERTALHTPPPPLTGDWPLVSILVPAYNEAATILETVRHLGDLHYPHYEAIVIDDGSQDTTPTILQALQPTTPWLRVIRLPHNGGKANALFAGLLAARGEFVLCLDADAVLDPDALRYILPHFTTPRHGERVGAVTGSPRVRNRSSLLARIQLAEYASIIGLIKRTQRLLGRVMTVSGVIVAFRKRALLDVGLWDKDLITDDIGVTWKLQRRFWDVRYEPRALCWMLVPETLRGLWRQRVRWAQGGLEVALRHADVLLDWRQRRLWPIYLEQVLSWLWSAAWLLTLGASLLAWLLPWGWQPHPWLSLYLVLVYLVQSALALGIESHYEPGLARYLLRAIWYPLIYWYGNVAYQIAALPRALRSRRHQAATWNSPDRGLPLPHEEAS